MINTPGILLADAQLFNSLYHSAQQCDKKAQVCFYLYSCYLKNIQLLSLSLINMKVISPSVIIRNVPFLRLSNNVLSHCSYSFPSQPSR